jgi:hypothetical protein
MERHRKKERDEAARRMQDEDDDEDEEGNSSLAFSRSQATGRKAVKKETRKGTRRVVEEIDED